MKNKANSNLGNLSVAARISDLKLLPRVSRCAPLMPWCLAPLVPYPKKHRRSAGGAKPIDTLQHGLGCRPERVERVEGAPLRLDKHARRGKTIILVRYKRPERIISCESDRPEPFADCRRPAVLQMSYRKRECNHENETRPAYLPVNSADSVRL